MATSGGTDRWCDRTHLHVDLDLHDHLNGYLDYDVDIDHHRDQHCHVDHDIDGHLNWHGDGHLNGTRYTDGDLDGDRDLHRDGDGREYQGERPRRQSAGRKPSLGLLRCWIESIDRNCDRNRDRHRPGLPEPEQCEDCQHTVHSDPGQPETHT